MLNLRNYFDIHEIKSYPGRFGIEAQLQELVESVQVGTIEINVDEAINRLAQSDLNAFDIDKFTDNVSSFNPKPDHQFSSCPHFFFFPFFFISFDCFVCVRVNLCLQLNEEITKRDLNTIADKLKETASKISSNSENSDIRTILKNQALHLNAYQDNLVTPMTIQTKEMLMLSHRLEENLRFNRSSFRVALNDFIKEIKFAQDFINKDGTEYVRKVRKIFTSFFFLHIWSLFHPFDLNIFVGCIRIGHQIQA